MIDCALSSCSRLPALPRVSQFQKCQVELRTQCYLGGILRPGVKFPLQETPPPGSHFKARDASTFLHSATHFSRVIVFAPKENVTLFNVVVFKKGHAEPIT